MHGRRVERVVAVHDAQKAGRLLERRARRGAAPSAAAGGSRNAPCSSRNATMFLASVSLRPEMRASSGADAVLTSAPTALTQSSTTASSLLRQLHLVDVVLILADADRLRLDAHELGERILQAARDRHRAAQRDVEVGKLLRRELRRRVDRRAGLGDDDLGERQLRVARDQVAGELVGLARRGAVADRDELRRRASRRAPPACGARLPSRCAARADRSSRCRAACRCRRRPRP